MALSNLTKPAHAHLSPKTSVVADGSVEERMAYLCKDSWIPYSQATAILKQLEDLLRYPRIERMPNLAICARTNNGKTRLMNHFLTQHPVDPNPAGGAIRVPVLYLQCPGVPDETRLYDAILVRLCSKFRPSANCRDKLRMVLSVLAEVDLRVLAIDEANYAESGSMDRQKTFLNALRYLGNELRISIVTLGTEEMLRVIRTVPAVENRFVPAFLPRWDFDDDFRRLLASFERIIPLREPSLLSDARLAAELHARSDGIIGELKMLLVAAARTAMQGEERITLDVINRCGYVSAPQRKRQMLPI